MKTLTIKQPWASLIAAGIKDIENRTWPTKFRGRIYIHASAKPARIAYEVEGQASVKEIQMFSTLNYVEENELYSAIIGEVDIIDCVINHPSIWAEQMAFDVCPETGIHILRRGQQYVWNWVLANAVLYDQPIGGVKGRLSFWEFEK